MSTPRPYVQSMKGWWWQNPYLLRYMLRELTSPLVAAYSLVLLAGLVALARGEAAWNGWVEAMRSPWSIAFHVVMLAVFAYHTWSWFEIMPKTLPPIYLGGRRVSSSAITTGGLVGALACCAILLGGALWLAR